jgi:hypothetical protein
MRPRPLPLSACLPPTTEALGSGVSLVVAVAQCADRLISGGVEIWTADASRPRARSDPFSMPWRMASFGDPLLMEPCHS